VVEEVRDEWGTAQSAGARIGACGQILSRLDKLQGVPTGG
jgi:hypothetical protein